MLQLHHVRRIVYNKKWHNIYESINPQHMQENVLQFIWKSGLFDHSGLTDADHKPVQILHPGFQNSDSGPDFLHARIRIDDTLWVGNVEIHVHEKSWYAHKHHLDAAYNNVVLHVCLESEGNTLNAEGMPVPVIQLSDRIDHSLLDCYEFLLKNSDPIPCFRLADRVLPLHWIQNTDFMATERLENRCQQILMELEHLQGDWDEMFYQLLCKSLGHKVNAQPMQNLARKLPYKLLQKYSENRTKTEALLFGTSGLLGGDFRHAYPKALKKEFQFLAKKHGLHPMSPEVWKFMRMRPASFPTLRLSQLAALMDAPRGLFRQLLEAESFTEILTWLGGSSSDYWESHYRFDVESVHKQTTTGLSTRYSLIINAVVPILFAYGKYRHEPQICEKAFNWLSEIEAEKNKVVNIFTNLGVPCENAMHSQGILHLYNNYCTLKRCLDCTVGRNLLYHKIERT
jgi:hypothetical protein